MLVATRRILFCLMALALLPACDAEINACLIDEDIAVCNTLCDGPRREERACRKRLEVARAVCDGRKKNPYWFDHAGACESVRRLYELKRERR